MFKSVLQRPAELSDYVINILVSVSETEALAIKWTGDLDPLEVQFLLFSAAQVMEDSLETYPEQSETVN